MEDFKRQIGKVVQAQVYSEADSRGFIVSMFITGTLRQIEMKDAVAFNLGTVEYAIGHAGENLIHFKACHVIDVFPPNGEPDDTDKRVLGIQMFS